MKPIFVFLLSQLQGIVFAAQSVIIQVIDTTYSTSLPFTINAVYYFFQLVTFAFKPNQKFYGWKEHGKALVYGLIDAFSNGFNIYSYNYTDAASDNLIVSLMVPFTLVLSCIFLKRKYNWAQVQCSIITILFTIMYGYLDS